MAATEQRMPRASTARDGGDEAGDGQGVAAAKEAAEDRLDRAGDDASQGADGAKSVAGDAVRAATDVLKEAGRAGSAGMVKSVVAAAREAAQEVLEREARAGAKQAAEYLVQKAPELAREHIDKAGGTGPASRAALEFGKAKLEGAGGAKAVASAGMGAMKGVVGKIKPGGHGKGKKTRRLPVFHAVDVGVPIDTAYNQWTQFEDAPKYMQRITNVQQVEDDKLKVDARIWGVNRSWELEITEQQPNDRIAWKTVGGSEHTGVVTFHELDENLTRVMVLLDFPPGGILEKMASGLRAVKRAARADLERFRAFIELQNEETGAWRGRIEDGEVVAEGEDEPEDQGDAQADEPPQAEEHEEPEAEAEDSDEPAAEQREPDDEADDDGVESGKRFRRTSEERESKGRAQPRRQRSTRSRTRSASA